MVRLFMMNGQNVNQPYDKIFRKLLSNKTEVVGLLNQHFHFQEKFTEENLERYHCKFVVECF